MQDHHRKEYREKGKISDPAILSDSRNYNPWLFSEDPFDYTGLIAQAGGISRVAHQHLGTRVAIVGAGCAGLCAAYELARIGLRPIVYESSGRIGGRAYTYRFPGDPNALAEIGAMRIPLVHKTVNYYRELFGIRQVPFPNPLTVPTTLYYNGKKHFVPLVDGKPQGIPEEIARASKKWDDFITPMINYVHEVWHDPIRRAERWRELVEKYFDKSLYEALAEHPDWTREDLAMFGIIGIGTGGFNSVYPGSIIEILRFAICKFEDDQQLFIGGTEQIPQGFWEREIDCTHWGKTSVSQLNGGATRKGVTDIRTAGDRVAVTDVTGATELYDAVIVTCATRALELNVRVERKIFSDDVWTAIRDTNMISSTKVFIRTKTAFWKQRPDLLTQTITDEPNRSIYLFDFDNTESGVICLAYCWGDSSTKFNALDTKQRLELCLRAVETIYGEETVKVLREQMVDEPVALAWEEAPGYHGAFKLTYPGQYRLLWSLFNQGKTEDHPDYGVYLAGESVSWVGGWIEGALHSGINAALSAIDRINGKNRVELPEAVAHAEGRVSLNRQQEVIGQSR